jgi:hypothetical protein
MAFKEEWPLLIIERSVVKMAFKEEWPLLRWRIQ